MPSTGLAYPSRRSFMSTAAAAGMAAMAPGALWAAEDIDPRSAYPLVDRIMADDDARDPTLASYQDDAISC